MLAVSVAIGDGSNDFTEKISKLNYTASTLGVFVKMLDCEQARVGNPEELGNQSTHKEVTFLQSY